MESLLILSILCILTGVIFRIIEEAPILDLLMFGLGILILMIWLNHTDPSALDVYRGKTTLDITYRDSIAVDSTVVFKNNN